MRSIHFPAKKDVLISEIPTVAVLCGTGLNRRTMPIRIGFGQYSGAICQKILSIGSMPFLIIVLDNLLIILLNAILRKYGGGLGDQYISYAAVVQSVMVVVICPAEGLTSGCATLFSYYYGSGNYKRILDSFRYVLLYTGLYLCALTVAIEVFPALFVRLFLSDPDVLTTLSESAQYKWNLWLI